MDIGYDDLLRRLLVDVSIQTCHIHRSFPLTKRNNRFAWAENNHHIQQLTSYPVFTIWFFLSHTVHRRTTRREPKPSSYAGQKGLDGVCELASHGLGLAFPDR